jgi:molybdopterin converting factor small subunit
VRRPVRCALGLSAGQGEVVGKFVGEGGAYGYSGRMRVRVLYFGVLRETMGRSDETIELRDGASAGDLLRILRMRTSNASMAKEPDGGVGGANAGAPPGVDSDSDFNSDSDARLWRSLAVAVNREYVRAETVLQGGDEVALLPPVSGGSFGPTRTAKGSLREQRLLSTGRRNES